MDEDKIKDSFAKVKQDISSLSNEISGLRKSLSLIGQGLSIINGKINGLLIPTKTEEKMTEPKINPTDNLAFKSIKAQNQVFSTGNGGVPTDRQTNQQTNQQTDFRGKNDKSSFENALGILSSLDSWIKEFRLRYKRLTDQEFLVFTTIYQVEEEAVEIITYKMVSSRLNLTESSIRDYVGKIVKKDIPVEKIKINNKSVSLKISEKLKKVASLTTIVQLREI